MSGAMTDTETEQSPFNATTGNIEMNLAARFSTSVSCYESTPLGIC